MMTEMKGQAPAKTFGTMVRMVRHAENCGYHDMQWRLGFLAWRKLVRHMENSGTSFEDWDRTCVNIPVRVDGMTGNITLVANSAEETRYIKFNPDRLGDVQDD